MGVKNENVVIQLHILHHVLHIYQLANNNQVIVFKNHVIILHHLRFLHVFPYFLIVL